MSFLSAIRVSINQKLDLLEDELQKTGHSPPHLLEAKPYAVLDDAENLPSQKVFDLIEQVQLDVNALQSLLTPTRFKLVELGMLHYNSAALNVVVQADVAQIIESLGGEAQLKDIAQRVSLNEHKLGRILRVLTGEFVFQETSHNVFKNTRHSIALTSSGARSFLSFITDLGMQSATGISSDLFNPETKDSFSERTAPFCKMVSKKNQTFAEYMGDPNNAAMVTLGNEGVVGWLNKLTRASLVNDYPWGELGKAKVIDLGCGTGDSGCDIMKQFPALSWVYQDLPPVIETLENEYPEELQEHVKKGKISFVTQDYFQPNQSDGDVWYMRGVLHEYDDEAVLIILKHVTDGMKRTPGSRLIINEVLNSSPAIIPKSSTSVPSGHIPENQSAMAATGNIMTWSTFSLFGGKERSYVEYEALLNTSGLLIARLYKFRTFTVNLECVLF